MSPAITTQTWLNEFFTCSARANPRQCAKVDSSHARRRDGKSINPSSAHHFYTCACVKGVEAGRLVCESLHPINMKLSCSVPFRSNRGGRSLTALGVRTQNGLRERIRLLLLLSVSVDGQDLCMQISHGECHLCSVSSRPFQCTLPPGGGGIALSVSITLPQSLLCVVCEASPCRAEMHYPSPARGCAGYARLGKLC